MRPITVRLAIACAVLAGCGGGGAGGGPDDAIPPFGEPAPDAPAGPTATVSQDGAGADAATPADTGRDVDDAPPAAREPAFEPSLNTVLLDVPVSSSQLVAQQTPIATADGAVYIANVEPRSDAPDGPGARLSTTVRRGVPGASGGGWTWQSTVIDTRTIWDPWHAPPGIGIDRAGFVHVGYNMHNFPWQYAVSEAPGSIASFEFRGEPVTDEELRLHVEENRTGFGGAGTADIPGIQITYPAFFNGADGELYVTYRRAARPARPFEERAMSAAIARHDADAGTWTSIGGARPYAPGDVLGSGGAPPAPPVVLASRPGWTAYPPSLEFDARGRMHVFWFWREGIAGETLTRPCAVVREPDGAWRLSDGRGVTPPLGPDACAGTGPDDAAVFRSVSDTALDPDGNLHVVLSPVGGERLIARRDGSGWRTEPSPANAGEIFFDAAGTLWAIADGPVAYRRPADVDAFEPVTNAPAPREQCYPRAALSEDRRTAYLHTRGCDADAVSVYRLRLLPPGGP